MKSHALPDGIRISAPAGVTVEPVPVTRAGPADVVVRALSDEEVTVVTSAALAPAPPRKGATRAPRPAEPSQVSVPVAPGERAIVLVERDGVYEWILPRSERRRAPTRARAGGAELVFSVAPDGAGGAPTRGVVSGLAAVVHVLKFPTHLVGDLAVRHLERNVKTGLVHVTGSSLDKWRITARLPALPKSRPARILLLVHGTFSSTIGGFGGFTKTPEGRALIEAALKGYDAVIGYNHRTLSVDPFDNAQEYLDVLTRLTAPKGMRIDAIAHSRGGLTLRSLIEHLLPAHPDIVVEKAILVACTNGGTQLARPSNWKALLDTYTNIAVAGATIGGTVAGPILAGALTGISTLAKYLVTASVGDEKAIPGLAAMNPDGPFVAAINAVQEGEPGPEGIVYDILTSDFEPIGGDEVSERLKAALKDSAVDRLMRGVENDGVVDVNGMRRIGPTEGYVDDELHFTPVEGISHSAYFTNPQAVRRMASWLGLLGEAPAPAPAGAPPAAPAPARGRRRRPAARPAGAKWTVMVFQAGFNSLTDFVTKDLREIQAATLDPAVRVSVFQCHRDRRGRKVALQALVGADGVLDERTELDGDVDSGNARTVLDFVRWTVERAPAERYALVLWSHGSGWEPDDLDQLYTSETGEPLSRAAVRPRAAVRRTLFSDTAVELLRRPRTRAILVDDGTGHSLDTLELGHVLAEVHTITGTPLALLGMDACLMNCVEIGYQLRKDVLAIVGSQEEEPGDGWPYTAILEDLSAHPDMTGCEWGARIAHRYADSYPDGEQVTQSVLDLTEIGGLVRPVNALARAIVAVSGTSNQNRYVVRGLVADALRFPGGMGPQADLAALCRSLKSAGFGSALDKACDAVLAALEPGGVVAARVNRGDGVASASGVSIYAPQTEASPEYRRLAFARNGDWDAALRAIGG